MSEDQVIISNGGDVIVLISGGVKGDAGPQGPGGGAAASFTFSQVGAQTDWAINHGLGFFPAVTVINAVGGNEVEGQVQYTDLNTLHILFDSAVAGTAYLS